MERRPTTKRRAALKETRFGSYLLGQRIAVGGMAEIFLARRTGGKEGDPPLVIKRILPQLAEDPSFVQMFVDEAKISSHLSHPNVVRVLDFGEVDGQCYLAMEHVDGVDAWRLLRRFTRARRSIPPEIASLVAAEALRGLEYVHAAVDADGVPLGIVHCDVSPSNVYVSKAGEVKIGDFGIARARLRRDRVEAGTLTGKFGYMAPEQVLGRSFDHRADLFAVGVVLAEMLTGEPLFTGSSKLTVLLAVRDVRIDPLRQRAVDYPPGLMAVLLRSLARDPTERYQSAGEFRLAIEEILAESVAAPTRGALGDAVVWAITLREPSAKAMPAVQIESTAPARGDETLRTPTGEGRFVFREPDETTSEPVDFARAVERVITAQASGDTLVSVDGAPYVPVRDVPELSRHLTSYAMVSDLVQTPSPELTGLIEKTSVPAILGRFVLGRATGLVLFEWGPARKEVYLVDGRPDFVSSNLAGELLGEFLVSRKVLSRGELDMALAVLPRFGGHLGESLVALGLVDPVKVVRHIADQVRDKLLELFRWRRGKYTFFPGASAPHSGFPLGIDPIEILCDGVRTGWSLSELEEWLATRKNQSVLRPPGSIVPPTLPPTQRRLLESVTAPAKIGDIVLRNRGSDSAEVLRAILLGVETGLLVPA